MHGFPLLFSFRFPGSVFLSTHGFPSPPVYLSCCPVSLSFLCIIFHFFIEVCSYISQLFLTCFYSPVSLSLSLSLLYPLWLVTVDEHSFPTGIMVSVLTLQSAVAGQIPGRLLFFFSYFFPLVKNVTPLPLIQVMTMLYQLQLTHELFMKIRHRCHTSILLDHDVVQK